MFRQAWAMLQVQTNRRKGQILQTDRPDITNRQARYYKQTGQISQTDRPDITNRHARDYKQTGQILQTDRPDIKYRQEAGRLTNRQMFDTN